MSYNRELAVAYAHQWAYGRNPNFYDFEHIGGDCTNFVSQCLLAGGAPMNYTPDLGWFYISLHRRSAAWTGVEFLYRFLVRNKGTGPYGIEAPLVTARPGDIVQLRFQKGVFSHSPIIVSVGHLPSPENILIAAHSYDDDNRPLNTYVYEDLRLIHILGAR